VDAGTQNYENRAKDSEGVLMDFLTFDIETTYGESNGRVGNRWDSEFGLCSIGWKKGKGDYSDEYTVIDVDGERKGRRPDVGLPFADLSDISVIVGHNVKFDLLWYWDHPEVKEFFKRGGKVWDTMYAEYLLSAQFFGGHTTGLTLKETAQRRKCDYAKLDIVAALWKDGVRTEDIDPDVLLEYQKYDVLTTEEVFLKQVKQARDQGQVVTIQQRMDGLLATTEMEFNGMKVDQEVAQEQRRELEESIKGQEEILEQYIPELPIGCIFNWASWRNVSALIFGGDLKYTGTTYSLDAEGHKQYYKKTIKEVVRDKNGDPVVYKSGKRKGEIKTKNITIPDTERGPKTKQAPFYYTLPGMAEPKDKWKSSVDGYWSTAEDVLTEIAETQGVKLVENLLYLKGMLKDLGTYYKRFSKGKWTGMLTNIQPDGCVHGQLNHSITVTSRLSSSKPNLQNIPKKGKSKIKKTFVSRFPEGKVVEIDYAQLEVVCKGVLSGDEELLQALIDKKCFHCEWVAFARGVDYEFVYQKAKVEGDPEWVQNRQDIKPLTFGETYGAGVTHLSEQSGLPADVVEAAIKARKLKYPKMYAFDDEVAESVGKTRKPTTLRTDEGYQKAIGYYRSPTGTIYSFMEIDSPGWKKDQGIHTAFSPTQMKNYPSQGLGGEVMQVQAGRVWRALVTRDLTDIILLINTVHDSIYADTINQEVAEKYLPMIAGLLEDVCPYFNETYTDVNWDTPFPVDVDYGDNILDTDVTIKERSKEWILRGK